MLFLITGFFSAQQATAQEGSCYLKANTQDVFVIVFDMDREGNQGRQIWQGRINHGESVKITTPNGRFRYDYNNQPDEKQPLSVGPDKWCDGKHDVAVP